MVFMAPDDSIDNKNRKSPPMPIFFHTPWCCIKLPYMELRNSSKCKKKKKWKLNNRRVLLSQWTFFVHWFFFVLLSRSKLKTMDIFCTQNEQKKNGRDKAQGEATTRTAYNVHVQPSSSFISFYKMGQCFRKYTERQHKVKRKTHRPLKNKTLATRINWV